MVGHNAQSSRSIRRYIIRALSLSSVVTAASPCATLSSTVHGKHNELTSFERVERRSERAGGRESERAKDVDLKNNIKKRAKRAKVTIAEANQALMDEGRKGREGGGTVYAKGNLTQRSG